jgi:hypothetical protein
LNVALAANGGVASAQNYTQDGVNPVFTSSPAYANDGVRYLTPSGDQYWRDEHGLSSWLQIDFNGARTINEIDVGTVRDDYATQGDPATTQTFTAYGATSFEVQYLNGSTWTTVPGGQITGKNQVWRTLSFSALTTSAIRVRINAAVDGVARLDEVEAWSATGPVPPAKNVALGSNGGVASAQNYTADYSGLSFRHHTLMTGCVIWEQTAITTGEMNTVCPEAVRWTREAARQGDAIAQYNLGQAYLDGEGVRENQKYARASLSKAAKQGHKKATQLLKSLEHSK